jgi:AcrR family transcriptional regulator
MTRNKNNSREKFMQTTLQLVNEKGFAETTIDEICAKSSLTKGAFYYYFKSKEDVLGQYLMDQIGQVDRGRRANLNEILLANNCFAQILLLLKPLIEVCERIGPKIILQTMLANYDFRYATTLIGRGHEDNIILSSLIAKGQKQGVFRNRQNADTLCEILGDAFYGMMFYWCYSNAAFDLKAKVEETLRGVLDVPDEM